MKALVIGASSGIGRALAERLARLGHRLHLVSSDARDVEAMASDLRLRFDCEASATAADLSSPDPERLRRDCLAALGGLDAIYYVAGVSDIERDPERLPDADVRRLLDVNFTSAVRLVNVLLPELEKSPRPLLVAVGSVAQARPRGRNTVYAAAKTGLEFYLEGLRPRLETRGGAVRFYRVGYADTAMTYGQSLALPKAAPEDIAAVIASGTGGRGLSAYLPRWWAAVALAYRAIPWPLFKRMAA